MTVVVVLYCQRSAANQRPNPTPAIPTYSCALRSKPLAAAASKPVFQALALAIAVLLFCRGLILVNQFRAERLFDAGLLRLRILELRDPALPAERAAVGALGLLRDGCAAAGSRVAGAAAAAGALAVANGTATLALAATAAANGYFLVTAAGDAGADPARWLLEASADNGSSWAAVGASGWRPALDLTDGLYPEALHSAAVGFSPNR
jgi:hypothetical protein